MTARRRPYRDAAEALDAVTLDAPPEAASVLAAGASDLRLAAELGIPGTPAWAPPARAGAETLELFGELRASGLTGPGWEVETPEGARSIVAWLQRVRRDGVGPYLEARRNEGGSWEVSILGIGPDTTADEIRAILPSLGSLRVAIRGRAGGRTPGRTKRSLADVSGAVAAYRRSTSRAEDPPAKWLAHRLDVSISTAEKYLRQHRSRRVSDVDR